MVGRANRSLLKGLGPEGIYSQTIFYLFLRPLFLFFQRTFSLPQQRREALLSRILSSVRGRGAVASRPWGERVLGAGRSNHGRGAMTIKEEGTTFCAFRNNYKGAKNRSCFWAFLLEMGCAGG